MTDTQDRMRVTIEVPATSANLGPGFDALGLSLELRNTYEFALSSAGPDIEITGEGAASLPHNEGHLSYRVCMDLLHRLGAPAEGLTIRQHNQVPLAGGLGNSATAVVAGLLAATALSNHSLSTDELLNMAFELEGHPDNAAAALLGGLVVCTRDQEEHVHCLRLPMPAGVTAVLAVPAFSLDTRRSRQILPAQVPLKDAIHNLSRTGLFVAAVCSGQWEALGQAMSDRLHEPFRARLVPGLMEVCAAAREAGAHGAALSGAGPTVIAMAPEANDVAQVVGRAMVSAFAEVGVQARSIAARPTSRGATVRVSMAAASE